MDPPPVACAGRDARSCPRRGCVHAFEVSEFCTYIVIGAGSDEPDESGQSSGRLERGPGEHGSEETAGSDDDGERARLAPPPREDGRLLLSAERPYACDEPGRAYRATLAGKLEEHTRTHTGERPYIEQFDSARGSPKRSLPPWILPSFDNDQFDELQLYGDAGAQLSVYIHT
jgi:hypothetical protein